MLFASFFFRFEKAKWQEITFLKPSPTRSKILQQLIMISPNEYLYTLIKLKKKSFEGCKKEYDINVMAAP